MATIIAGYQLFILTMRLLRNRRGKLVMADLKSESNKALVLKAFDTLFNKRDYAAAENFGPLIIFSIAHTLQMVAMVCLI
jgi:hypothetical protein